ncbi:MAG TPA: hypothetical protein VMS78_13785, partial [Rhizomicrobium sp.]|nr:hypothetical protein [Rhizomicrobium sp.]
MAAPGLKRPVPRLVSNVLAIPQEALPFEGLERKTTLGRQTAKTRFGVDAGNYFCAAVRSAECGGPKNRFPAIIAKTGAENFAQRFRRQWRGRSFGWRTVSAVTSNVTGARTSACPARLIPSTPDARRCALIFRSCSRKNAGQNWRRDADAHEGDRILSLYSRVGLAARAGGEWLREQSPQEASENEYRTSNLRFQGLMLIFFFYLTQRLRPKA